MPDQPHHEEIGPFQFVILVLSLSLLAGLAADLIVSLPPEVSRLIQYLDTAVCLVFMADVIHRFRHAPSKWRFMKWGWIDVLASVPYVEALRWGRVFRIFRIVRLVVAVRSIRRMRELLLASKARAGMASIFTLGFVVIAFSSVCILLVEAPAGGNIKTAEQALWWSLVTVTTVGYGDFYPVTTAGRLVAVFTMIAGVGLFGAMSGVVASLLLGSDRKEEDEVLAEIRALRVEVARLAETERGGAAKAADSREQRDATPRS